MGNYSLPDFDHPPSLAVQVQALHTWGALLLRSCLAPEPLQLWCKELEVLYAAADHALEMGRMSPATYTRCYQYGHLPVGTWPRQDQFAHEVLHQPLLHPLLRYCCGPEPALLYKSMLPRRQHPFWPERRIPFHQDAEFLAGRFALNLWLPLNRCGREAPGLELLLKPLKKLWFCLGEDTSIPLYQQRNERSVLASAPAEYFWQPQMEPGDVLIFDSFLLHRTWLTPSMFLPRYSLEIRLTHPVWAQGLPYKRLFL